MEEYEVLIVETKTHSVRVKALSVNDAAEKVEARYLQDEEALKRDARKADENSKELANNFEHLSNNLQNIVFMQSRKVWLEQMQKEEVVK